MWMAPSKPASTEAGTASSQSRKAELAEVILIERTGDSVLKIIMSNTPQPGTQETTRNFNPGVLPLKCQLTSRPKSLDPSALENLAFEFANAVAATEFPAPPPKQSFDDPSNMNPRIQVQMPMYSDFAFSLGWQNSPLTLSVDPVVRKRGRDEGLLPTNHPQVPAKYPGEKKFREELERTWLGGSNKLCLWEAPPAELVESFRAISVIVKQVDIAALCNYMETRCCSASFRFSIHGLPKIDGNFIIKDFLNDLVNRGLLEKAPKIDFRSRMNTAHLTLVFDKLQLLDAYYLWCFFHLNDLRMEYRGDPEAPWQKQFIGEKLDSLLNNDVK
jgi:hypothetical protein